MGFKCLYAGFEACFGWDPRTPEKRVLLTELVSVASLPLRGRRKPAPYTMWSWFSATPEGTGGGV